MTEKHLLELAEQKRALLARWSKLNHWAHLGVSTTSYIMSLAIPFGLALLFYFDAENQRMLNIALIVASAIAAILQFVDHTMRLPERARHGARLLHLLEVDVARYKDGRLSPDHFERSVTNALLESAEEPWA